MPDARVSILIEANDRANGVLDRLRANLGGVNGRGGIVGAAGGATRALSAIGFAVFGIQQITSAVGSLGSAFFGFNMDLEQATITYGSLLGSAEAAQKRIAELQEFANVTPFDFKQVMEADRLLETFGARSVEMLTLVGDAASGTGQNFNEVAFWIGRSYSAIQAGQPFGEAAMRLQEMGILTAKGRVELERLTDAGASSEEIWAVMNDEMGRFSGLMDKQSKSGRGLLATLKDLWTQGIAKLTAPVYARFLKGLGAVVKFLGSPFTQMTLGRFADQIDGILDSLFGTGGKEGFKKEGIIPAAIRAIQNALAGFGGIKGVVGSFFDGFIDAMNRVGKAAIWLYDNAIKPLIEWVRKLLEKFGLFAGDPDVNKIAEILGAIAAFAIAAATAMAGLGLVLGPIGAVASVAGTGFSLMGTGLSTIATIGSLAVAALTLVGTALAYLVAIALAPFAVSLLVLEGALLGILALNPVSLTIAAIAAAILLWDKIPWTTIGEGIVKLAVAIKDKLGEALDSLPELPGIIGQAIYDAIYGLVNLPAYIIESLSTLAQNLIGKLGERIAAIPFGPIKDAIAIAINAALDALSQLPGLFTAAGSALGSMLMDLIANFPGAARKLGEALGAAFEFLKDNLPGALKKAAEDVGASILNFITAPLGNYADRARTWIREQLSKLADTLGSVATAAGTLGVKIVGAIADGFGAVTSFVGRLVGAIAGWIRDVASDPGVLLGAAEALGGKVIGWVADGFAAVANFAIRLAGQVALFVVDVWATSSALITGVAGTLGGKILDWVAAGFGAVTDFASGLAGWIGGRVSWLAGETGAVVKSAASVIGSLIPGWIASGFGSGYSFIASLASWLKDKIKQAWDSIPKPWDLFGATPGSINQPGDPLASGGTGGGFGMPIVVQLYFQGPTLATEADMQRAARLLVPPLRRELDRLYI